MSSLTETESYGSRPPPPPARQTVVPRLASAPRRRGNAAASWLILALCWTSLPFRNPTPAAEPPSGDAFGRDDLVAALILKVLPFVVFPKDTGPDGPRVIAVVGAPGFLPTLQALAVRSSATGPGLVVTQVTTPASFPPCHVLVFPGDRSGDLTTVPPERRRGLLTIGQDPLFTRSGGVMNISPAARGLTLTINTRNARAADLEIESRLLRIAEVER